jgi:pyrroloquinoline quinone (PQQ) biosynthesis protein C
MAADPGQDIVRFIAERSLKAAMSWRWCREPLTPGAAQAFFLQHVLRNRFYSSVLRPAWLSRCDALDVVRKTINQMRQELVFDDEIQASHTKILREFAGIIGLSEEQLDRSRPEPKVALYFTALEGLARERHWLVGWIATSIDEFIGGHLEGHNYHADRWKEQLGLTEEQVFFWRYHEKADLDHGGYAVWEPIRRHVTSEALRSEIRDGLEVALEAHSNFFEGIALLGERLDRQGARLPHSSGQGR